MNPGESVPDASRSRPDDASRSRPDDASRSRPDDASRLGAAAGYGIGKPARSPRTLQDIQDIIDKLAAVTQQLGRPGASHSKGSGPAADARCRPR